jgi:hypothetical protein
MRQTRAESRNIYPRLNQSFAGYPPMSGYVFARRTESAHLAAEVRVGTPSFA